MSATMKLFSPLLQRIGYADYPSHCNVSNANQQTIDFIRTTKCRVIAELGIYKGFTSEKLAEYLGGEGELHLFDFEERVAEVTAKLKAKGYHNIVGHSNSHKIMDSYNWSLMQVLKAHPTPLYDYVFLDGAHTWNVDALAFTLIDRLLKVGGFMDFDDYDWSLERSPTLNPKVFPRTRKLYTDEQIRQQHVRLILDVLVKRDPRYKEVVENKIYQKIG